jgi:heme/copper-type cytochrome/quinol oxidase subunit 2
MTELYWITRLDAICGVAIIILIISMLVSFIGFLVRVSAESEKDSDYAKGNRIMKRSLPVTVFAILVLAFTPSSDEALMIYGVGGTIDYIKSNDKAKKLPDKCIEALDKYLDNINKEEKDK